MGGYNIYKDKILQFDGTETWAKDTDLAFKVDGKTFGFPVAIEGWGMAYNKTILEAAFLHEGNGRTIDSLKVVSQAEYQEAFTAVQNYYDANSMTDSVVVSLSASAGMTWVTGLHNFNGYLSAGLPYGDSQVIDKLNNGVVDEARLTQHANWVELLFNNTNQSMLTSGTYDEQG